MARERVSVKAAKQQAEREEAKVRKSFTADASGTHIATVDSFQNFQAKIGMGTDNMLSASTYGFNPVTRNRTLMEWIHRGSWLGGIAVDALADDMTREGAYMTCEMPPEDTEVIQRVVDELDVWTAIGDAIRWGRLYGGGLAIALIDGQDLRQPLRPETVGPGQFRGLFALDRWQVEPSLDDLVTEQGPHMGEPRYYRIQQNAPALRGCVVHHSRVVVRHIGHKLPYQQALMENLWGASVLERLYDRMVAFDFATQGAAQLVSKAFLRTFKIDGMRDLVAAGGDMMNGLALYVDQVRRFQGIEGATMIDAKDEFDIQGAQTFSGVSDVILTIGQQIAGALEMPLVRLFGQSPAGLSSTGESDVRTYYDNVKKRQRRDIGHGVTLTYRLICQSRAISVPTNFGTDFNPLWQMTLEEKLNAAKTLAELIQTAADAGLISQQVAMKELRQQSRQTSVFTNITQQDILKAEQEVDPPMGDDEMALMMAQAQAGQPGAEDGNEEAADNPMEQGAAGGKVVPIAAPAGGATGGTPRKRFGT